MITPDHAADPILMKQFREPVQVQCAGRRPLVFRRARSRTFFIERILRVWVVQTAWWEEEVYHVYYEVVARNGVYVLRCQNRSEGTWQLIGCAD